MVGPCPARPSRADAFHASDTCRCHGMQLANLNGQHTITSESDGSTIAGSWVEGVCQNQSEWTDATNGLRYHGGWKDFRFEGHGVFIWRDGSYMNGIFEQDRPQTGLLADAGQPPRAIEFDGNTTIFHPDIKAQSGQDCEVQPALPAFSTHPLEVRRTASDTQSHLSFGILAPNSLRSSRSRAVRDSTDSSHASDALPTSAGQIMNANSCSCHGIAAGQLQGLHRLRWLDGSFYVGQWLNGMPEGDGRWSLLGTGTYEGSWCNGVFHGPGLFIYPDGEMLDGVFWNSCPVAWCTLTKSDGSRHEVQFDGTRNVTDELLTPTACTKLAIPNLQPVSVDSQPLQYENSHIFHQGEDEQEISLRLVSVPPFSVSDVQSDLHLSQLLQQQQQQQKEQQQHQQEQQQQNSFQPLRWPDTKMQPNTHKRHSSNGHVEVGKGDERGAGGEQSEHSELLAMHRALSEQGCVVATTQPPHATKGPAKSVHQNEQQKQHQQQKMQEQIQIQDISMKIHMKQRQIQQLQHIQQSKQGAHKHTQIFQEHIQQLQQMQYIQQMMKQQQKQTLRELQNQQEQNDTEKMNKYQSIQPNTEQNSLEPAVAHHNNSFASKSAKSLPQIFIRNPAQDQKSTSPGTRSTGGGHRGQRVVDHNANENEAGVKDNEQLLRDDIQGIDDNARQAIAKLNAQLSFVYKKRLLPAVQPNVQLEIAVLNNQLAKIGRVSKMQEEGSTNETLSDMQGKFLNEIDELDKQLHELYEEEEDEQASPPSLFQKARTLRDSKIVYRDRIASAESSPAMVGKTLLSLGNGKEGGSEEGEEEENTGDMDQPGGRGRTMTTNEEEREWEEEEEEQKELNLHASAFMRQRTCRDSKVVTRERSTEGSAWTQTKAEDNKETLESHDFSRHPEDTTFALQNTQLTQQSQGQQRQQQLQQLHTLLQLQMQQQQQRMQIAHKEAPGSHGAHAKARRLPNKSPSISPPRVGQRLQSPDSQHLPRAQIKVQVEAQRSKRDLQQLSTPPKHHLSSPPIADPRTKNTPALIQAWAVAQRLGRPSESSEQQNVDSAHLMQHQQMQMQPTNELSDEDEFDFRSVLHNMQTHMKMYSSRSAEVGFQTSENPIKSVLESSRLSFRNFAPKFQRFQEVISAESPSTEIPLLWNRPTSIVDLKGLLPSKPGPNFTDSFDGRTLSCESGPQSSILRTKSAFSISRTSSNSRRQSTRRSLSRGESKGQKVSSRSPVREFLQSPNRDPGSAKRVKFARGTDIQTTLEYARWLEPC